MDWKSLVGAVAPTIATALGGPLAGLGVKAISEVLLGKPDGSEVEVAQAVASATPDQLLALKKADQDFTARMRELEIDLEKLAVDDRKDARAMQVQTGSWLPPALAVLVTIGFFGVLAYLIKFGLSPDSAGHGAILMVLGSLATAWTAIISYYFGSSAGSARKDAALRGMGRK